QRQLSSSRSSRRRPPSQPALTSLSLSTNFTPASLIMYSSRSSGYSASSGRYAPPAFSTPSIPSTIRTVRPTRNPTTSSAPTPASRRYLPNRSPLLFNSSWLNSSPSLRTATATPRRSATTSHSSVTYFSRHSSASPAPPPSFHSYNISCRSHSLPILNSPTRCSLPPLIPLHSSS